MKCSYMLALVALSLWAIFFLQTVLVPTPTLSPIYIQEMIYHVAP